MLKIVGNDVYRGAEKIGYFEGNDLYDHEARKVGYFSGNDVYDRNGRKMGYLESEYLRTTDGGTIRLSENRRAIAGGSLSDLGRAAVRILLGD